MSISGKHVLILTSTFPRWRSDTDPPFVFDLCKRLDDKYCVHVICPHVYGAKKEEVVDGINVKRFRYFFEKLQTLAYEGGILNRLKQKPYRYLLVPFFIFGELISTIRLLSKTDVSIINAHWVIPQGIVAVAVKKIFRPGIPLVCTLHGADVFAVRGFILNHLKRYILKNSSAVIVVSNAMKDRVVSLGIDEKKINIIPMGVDLVNDFIPPFSRRTDKSILFVGRFVKKKGLPYLLKAMALIVKKHPRIHLNIAGHGPEEQALKKMVRNLNLDNDVTFLGPVENRNLPAVYQASQIVVFPFVEENSGDMEGFGLVLVEALGCECAVIVSDVPAIHDIIKDNKTGFIVGQRNVEMIAEKISYLLGSVDTCRCLGCEGRNYVLERFDWQITAHKYCKLFKQLTDSK